jgi:hypothetical protein
MFPTWNDWQLKYTAEALNKKRRKAVLQMFAYVLLTFGIYRARKAGRTFSDFQTLIRNSLRAALKAGATGLQNIGAKV